MEIRSRIFEKYDTYRLTIPLKQGDKVLAKKGSIKAEDELIERVENTIKKSLYIPKILGCKIQDCEKYTVSMDGEYVEKGELIAQRVSPGGLTVIDMISPVNGVLDFSRISQGYIDILGEERKTIVKSDFNGIVEDFDPSIGLNITTSVIAIDGVVSSKADNILFGQLDVLGDGNTILTKASLEKDYKGKIVWVGPYLYSSVAIELFERGAIAVLTYAMSYDEFRNLGLPIMILGGFGSVHCDSSFLKKFLTLVNSYVVVDNTQSQLFVISDMQVKNKQWFVNQYVNQSVISRNPSSYGYIGKTIDYEQESKFVLVDFDKKGTSLIHLGLVEFVDL